MKSVLIGYGYWGRILEKYINESINFELIGIVDPLLDGALTINDILDNNDVECAFVSTPIDTHFTIVKSLIEHGIHTFCEKPLCKSKSQVDILIKLAEEKKCLLYTDYIYTNSPSLNFIKKHITDLGAVLYIDMEITQFGLFYKEDDVFDVLAVHLLSAVLFLFSDIQNSLTIRNVEVIEKNQWGIVEEGNVAFSIKNIPGKLYCSQISEKKNRRIRLVCEQGAIIFDMMAEYTVEIIQHEKKGGRKEKNIIVQEKYDEANNLNSALKSFYQNIIKMEKENCWLSSSVSDALEMIKLQMNS